MKTIARIRPQLAQDSSTFFELSKSYYSNGLKPHVFMRKSELVGRKPESSCLTTPDSTCRDKSRKFETCSLFPTASHEYQITHYPFKNPTDQLS